MFMPADFTALKQCSRDRTIARNTAKELARFQQPGELDRVFSETCLTLFDLCELVPSSTVGLVGVGVPTKRAKPLDGSSVLCDDDQLQPGVSPNPEHEARLRCFGAVWYQLTGGQETLDSLVQSGNWLCSNRRDVIAPATLFRFSVQANPLARQLRDHLLQYRSRVDTLVECTHILRCGKRNHESCELSRVGPEVSSLVTVRRLANDTLVGLRRFLRSSVARADLCTATAVRQQTWSQMHELWLATLALSTTLMQLANRLVPRLARLVDQLARIPRTPKSIVRCHVIQLYALRLVGTFETLRQLDVNLQRAVVKSAFRQFSDAANRGRRYLDDDDDYQHDEHELDESRMVVEVDEHTARMDWLVNTTEENHRFAEMRDFLLDYCRDDKRGAAASSPSAAVRASMASDAGYEELSRLERIALALYRCVVFLSYDEGVSVKSSPRAARFVEAINNATAKKGVRLRTPSDIRKRLVGGVGNGDGGGGGGIDRNNGGRGGGVARKSVDVDDDGDGDDDYMDDELDTESDTVNVAATTGNLFEMQTLVRQVDELLTTVTGKTRGYSCASVAPSTAVALAELNDTNFQLTERNWSDCANWVFAPCDQYKFTYLYAILSRVRSYETLRELRQLISLYTELLRLKAYRLLFVRQPTLSAATSNTVAPSPTDQNKPASSVASSPIASVNNNTPVAVLPTKQADDNDDDDDDDDRPLARMLDNIVSSIRARNDATDRIYDTLVRLEQISRSTSPPANTTNLSP